MPGQQVCQLISEKIIFILSGTRAKKIATRVELKLGQFAEV